MQFNNYKTKLRNLYFVISSVYFLFKNFKNFGLIENKNKNKIYTYNNYHFGDNANDINFLLQVAKNYPHKIFHHYCNQKYIVDLRKYIGDVKNLFIHPLNQRPWFAINMWKNYLGKWDKNAEKYDFIKFQISHYDELAENFSVINPLKTPQDFLFEGKNFIDDGAKCDSYHYLIVNSIPLSGQFSGEIDAIDKLAIDLVKENLRVITTRKIEGIECTLDQNMGLYEIGCLSKSCENLLMISTGPSWFALNTTTFKNCKSITLILDSEFIDIQPKVKTIKNINQIIL